MEEAADAFSEGSVSGLLLDAERAFVSAVFISVFLEAYVVSVPLRKFFMSFVFIGYGAPSTVNVFS